MHKVGITVCRRSSGVQMPAYDMIVEPEPISYAVDAFLFPPEQLPPVPLKGWLAPNWCPISWATKSM